MRKILRVVNILLTVALTIGFILLSIFVFKDSYFRAFEGLIDLLNSFKYYFCEILGIEHTTVATVENYSGIMDWNIFLPAELDDFLIKIKAFGHLLISGENFNDWSSKAVKTIGNFAKIFAIILPCFLLLVWCIKKIYLRPNNNYNQDSKPLYIYKGFMNITVRPVITFIRQYVEFLKGIKPLVIIWIINWVFNLNVASIIIEFFAYYFYFAVSYRFQTIYVQFCKLLIDLGVIFKYVPIWIIVIVCLIIWDIIRKKIAKRKLRHMEARNCGFINELPIVSMTVGSMGKKKTTIITDMALSQEVMFRQKALELLQKADMKFPNFPWICFEQELQQCMEYGTVYNLATIKEWVRLKARRFEKNHESDLQLYGYDCEKYGLSFDDSLKVETLFSVLETYAQLYFIYVVESSLILSNYSIREDNLLLSKGNFPLWCSDFFPNFTVGESRHAHILDFDVLRLGKKVIENNPKNGSFEFGVVVISEVGKERGNNLELKEIKKGNDEANQKNDLFNSWLKMCRHSATVDNFPFIKVFTDEQRPESWGADARDLCDIVSIVGSTETRLALPFYTIEDMIAEWTYGKFIDLYTDIRYLRGDNTLFVHLLKSITAFIFKYNLKIYNRFGYSISTVEKERGTQDGKIEKKKYFVMNKKIYSRRFSTDCFSDYFNDMAKKTEVGLNDYIEYETERATVEELKQQNSYFINALYKDTGSDN